MKKFFNNCEKCGVEFGRHPDSLGHHFQGEPWATNSEPHTQQLPELTFEDFDTTNGLPHGFSDWENYYCALAEFRRKDLESAKQEAFTDGFSHGLDQGYQKGAQEERERCMSVVREYLGYGFTGTNKMDQMSQDSMLKIIIRSLSLPTTETKGND